MDTATPALPTFVFILAALTPGQTPVLPATASLPTSPGTYSVVVATVGDVDGDGSPDLAIAEVRSWVTPGPGSISVLSGTDASVLVTLDSTPFAAYFGWSMQPLGDVDGDGVPDLLIGGMATNTPVFVAYSCATGLPIWINVLPGPLTVGPGPILAAIGDVNGDGISDFVDPDGAGPNATQIRSGADGTLLRGITGFPVGASYGFNAAGVGDVTGDGVPDFVVGSNYFGNRAAGLFSGATGAEIRSWPVVGPIGWAYALAGPGDVDDDGVPDIAIATSPNTATGSEGQITVWSGATNQQVFSVQGEMVAMNLGLLLTGAGDVDGDTVPDLATVATAPFASTSPDVVRFLSGRDGSTIANFELPTPLSRANRIATPGDIDGDGCSDVAVGSQEWSPPPIPSGRVQLIRGPGPALDVLSPASITSGAFALQARCPLEANAPWIALFSMSTLPGIALPDGRTIPLALDALTVLAVTPGNGVFFNVAGTLDAAGIAPTAVSVLLPNDPALIGVTIWTALVTADPGGAWGVGRIGRSRPLLIVP
ncbi:MAG: hypothetical protein CMJ83_05175 [Planctomycetes bacterium]|nr:hypothetical protein [Planctomycetota bacterium]